MNDNDNKRFLDSWKVSDYIKKNFKVDYDCEKELEHSITFNCFDETSFLFKEYGYTGCIMLALEPYEIKCIKKYVVITNLDTNTFTIEISGDICRKN